MIYVSGDLNELLVTDYGNGEETNEENIVTSILNAPIMSGEKVIGVINSIDPDVGIWEGVLFKIPFIESIRTGDNCFVSNVTLLNQKEIFNEKMKGFS